MEDLTYVAITAGFVYVAVVLDAWSRRIVGYAIGRSLDARIAVAAPDRAIALRRPLPGCVFHSDRGSQCPRPCQNRRMVQSTRTGAVHIAPSVVADGPRRALSKRIGPVRLSGSGERLRGVAPLPDYPPSTLVADFRYGDLAPSDFPALTCKCAMAAAMARPPARLAYGDPRGWRRLRLSLPDYLWRARTVSCDLEQIIIVNGSQQALDLCARLLLDPADRFVMENTRYRMAHLGLRRHGRLPRPDRGRPRRADYGSARRHLGAARLCHALTSVFARRRPADPSAASAARFGAAQ